MGLEGKPGRFKRGYWRPPKLGNRGPWAAPRAEEGLFNKPFDREPSGVYGWNVQL